MSKIQGNIFFLHNYIHLYFKSQLYLLKGLPWVKTLVAMHFGKGKALNFVAIMITIGWGWGVVNPTI